MSFSEIILMNVGIAAILVAILALVMLIPTRLTIQHPTTGGRRRKRADYRRAAVQGRRAPDAGRRGLRPIGDQN